MDRGGKGSVAFEDTVPTGILDLITCLALTTPAGGTTSQVVGLDLPPHLIGQNLRSTRPNPGQNPPHQLKRLQVKGMQIIGGVLSTNCPGEIDHTMQLEKLSTGGAASTTPTGGAKSTSPIVGGGGDCK